MRRAIGHRYFYWVDETTVNFDTVVEFLDGFSEHVFRHTHLSAPRSVDEHDWNLLGYSGGIGTLLYPEKFFAEMEEHEVSFETYNKYFKEFMY